jgi:hypothetical protein
MPRSKKNVILMISDDCRVIAYSHDEPNDDDN